MALLLVVLRLLHNGSRSNNSSCVLLLEFGGHRVLLAGDIESVVESRLLSAHPTALRDLSVLVVPHHGSLTSSSVGFVSWTRPKLSLISAGWNHRLSLPKPEVVQRYQSVGSRVFNTGECGHVRIKLDGQGSVIEHVERGGRRRHWRRDRGSTTACDTDKDS